MSAEPSSSQTPEKVVVRCAHCALPVPQSELANDAEQRFCCPGCRCVYEVIKGLGLEEYYRLRESLETETSSPANPGVLQYRFFNDPQFQERYVSLIDSERADVRFYLKDMHCAACVWLLERLPVICSGVKEARANYGRSQVLIRFNPTLVSLSTIAERLDSLGYPPRPLSDLKHGERRKKERSDNVLRLGIAGLSAGNTMMLAVSLYQGWFSGIEQEYQRFFSLISLLLSIPAVAYSAIPFYRAALVGLRARMLHIDLPISIGIILGFSASVVNTLRDEGHVYYDSICALIFLLLAGRWLQRASVDKVLERAELMYSLAPRSARRVTATGVEEIYSGSLQPGDTIILAPGEVSSADGVIREGQSAFDRSVLTGESRPVPASIGDLVYAGTRNLESEVQVEVEKVDEDSRMGSLLRLLEETAQHRAPLVEATDRIAGYFVATVLTLAAGTTVYWSIVSGFEMAFESTLALLVVSCPCALGLAAPLSLSVALSAAARAGIFIKESAVFERMDRIGHVCFDKTGTLTRGEPTIQEYYIEESSGYEYPQLLELIVRLEAQEVHPVAEAFRSAREDCEGVELQSIPFLVATNARLGSGVLGHDAEAQIWRFGSIMWMQQEGVTLSGEFVRHCDDFKKRQLTPVVLSNNLDAIAVFGLGDTLREEAKFVVDSLKKQGLEVSILSGDHQEIVNALAEIIGIKDSFVYGGLEPEGKAAKLEQLTQHCPVMMVGDGVNDAAAIATADVGVAVRGGAEASLRSADVFFSKNELQGVLRLLSGTRTTLAVVRRNLIVSLLYNVIGASLAIVGLVSPLLAAVLMPLSSLTVLLSSLTLAGNSFEKSR